jgi:homoserine kinase type II
MAQFRTLTPSDVRALLDAFGVGEARYRAHAPIAAGTINTNVRVELDDGTARFLRVNEGKALADVEREAAIVEHVVARGVTTPAPVRTPAGTPHARLGGAYVSLFPWVEGRTLRREGVGPAHARSAASALARLHLAGADFPDHRPGRYEPDEIAARFTRIAALGAPELADAVATLGPELARTSDPTVRRPGLPLGLIHGDLFIDNVLYAHPREGVDDGRLVALLDFEQASWGRLAYDVAVSVLAFGFGRDDFREDVTRAFLDGYAAVRTPTPDERAGFGAELCFAACRFAVTRITDVHLRRGEGTPGGKDFRRYLARLARVQDHLARRTGLLDLP